MPSNVFANTGTNVSVLFFDNSRATEKVILVDASKLGEEYKEGNNQKKRLRPEEIDKIVDTFREKKAEDGFSVAVTYDEIKEKGYSLSAGQYFDIKIEYVDITAEEFEQRMNGYRSKLTELFNESHRLESEILKQLNSPQIQLLISMAKVIQFILYNLPDNSGTVQAYVENETLWLTQKAMSQLFDVSVPAINQHLKNIYETNELTPEATIKKNLIVQQEGNRQVKREQTFYSLDAIISVGYRVNSQRATLFRQWATRVLNEYIRKGFVLDDDRLKQGNAVFGQDYFGNFLREFAQSEPANGEFGNR